MSGSVEKLFAFRQPSLLSVSESGLYKLIMRSRKPEAKKFQNWVTQVVLLQSARTACMCAGRRRFQPVRWTLKN